MTSRIDLFTLICITLVADKQTSRGILMEEHLKKHCVRIIRITLDAQKQLVSPLEEVEELGGPAQEGQHPSQQPPMPSWPPLP